MATLFATDRVFHLRLGGPPVAQPRYKLAVRNRKYPVAYIQSDHPIHDYRKFVKLSARRKWKYPMLVGPLESQLLFVSQIEGGGDWKDTQPDLDNLVKPVWDELVGLLYENDGRICHTVQDKRFRFAWEKPFVEIVVKKIDKDRRPPMRLVVEDQ